MDYILLLHLGLLSVTGLCDTLVQFISENGTKYEVLVEGCYSHKGVFTFVPVSMLCVMIVG